MTELPQSFYVERVRTQRDSSLRLWLAIIAAIASGWTLFGLPGNPVHLLRLPEDVPSFGVGLGDVYVQPDGSWVVQRMYYADRMGRYEFDANGTLHKYRGALRAAESMQMRAARLDPADLQMAEGHMPGVRPSRKYFHDRAKYRSEHVKVPVRDEGIPQTVEQKALDRALAHNNIKEPYVVLFVYGDETAQANLLLQGHTFYEVLDDSCFHDPYMWITTDRVQNLSRIRATDRGGKIVVKVEQTVPLKLAKQPEYDCKLGLDKFRQQLVLLTPTGERYWYDPMTLKQLGHEQLPGVWEREYASVGFVSSTRDYPGYPEGSGYALTERGYKGLMRGLALVFIASLLTLALELLRAWRSTSERTTAATS